MISLILRHFQHLVDDAGDAGDLDVFELFAVNLGGVDGADPADRGVEVVEGLFLDEEGDLGADAAEGLVFLD